MMMVGRRMPAETFSSSTDIGGVSVLSRTTTDRRPSLRDLRYAPLYSEELGIQLWRRDDDAYFRWFLASLLFGGRISENIAANTYRAFERHGLLSPQSVIDAGLSFLVDPIMREGGYVRYDGRKSMQILRNCKTLLTAYNGSLARLHKTASDSAELEGRLRRFHGIGPVTANIFLRELRPFWRKADPEPLSVVVVLAGKLGIDLNAIDRKSLTFARIEAGLIRHRKSIGGKSASRRR